MPKRSNPEKINPEAEIATDIEKIVDTQIETILRRAEKINEGNNGIICLIDINAIPGLEQLRKKIGKQEIALGKEQAIKILKIYKPGSGRQEFAMQQKAYEILASAPQVNTAKVPRPIMFRDIALEQSVQERLNTMGAHLTSQHAEIIIMDYIPSDDLATFLFREAVKMLPDNKGKEQSVDLYDFQSLHRILAEELKFEIPDRQSPNFEQAAQQCFSQNIQRVFSFLTKKGYTKQPEKKQVLQSIATQIRNAVNLFGQNGLALRDSHERNFLIEKGKDGPQVFIIDFGEAKKVDRPLVVDDLIFQEETGPGLIKKFPPDHKIQEKLFALIKEGEDEIFEPNAMEKLISKHQRSPDFTKILKNLETGEMDLKTAFNFITAKPNTFPNPSESCSALVFAGLKINAITKEEATQVLLTQAQKSIGEKKNLLLKTMSSL